MIDQPNLRKLIHDSGLRFNYVAEQMGISPQNLNNKLATGRFLPTQRIDLARILGFAESELFPEQEVEEAVTA